MAEKILIVDDDPNALRLIGYALQRQGYEIVAAQNGQDAIDKALNEKTKPDLIVLDLMMPEMDGYEVLRRLRANPTMSRVPVILFTAKAQVDDKITGFEAGADDYLTKPVTPAELIARVKALLLRASYTAPERPQAQVIGFLGVKGGAGTTSIALNVAVALAQKEKRVILVECQPYLGTPARQMGLRPRSTLASLGQMKADAIDQASVESCITKHHTGVRVIPAPLKPKATTQPIMPGHAQALINHLNNLAQIVILDLGSQLTPTVRQLLGHCDNAIYVSEADDIALEMIKMLLQEGENLGVRTDALLKIIVVNRIRTAVALTRPDTEDKLEQELLAFIPPAPELFRQGERDGHPAILVQPDGLHANMFRQVADALLDL